MRPATWLTRHAFDGLVIALAAIQEVEVWLADVPGPPVAVMLATALWTLPLLLRRRWPLAAPAFAFAVQIGASFADPVAFGEEASGLVALLLAFWAVGAQERASQAIAGAAIGCAAVAVIGERDVRVDGGGAIFVMAMGVAVTLIAFTLRHRAARTAELERHAGGLLREQERDAREAVAAERARIARDLHEVIAQSLRTMTTEAAAARHLLESDPERAREPILAIEDTGRHTLAELRRLLGLLHQAPGEAARVPEPGMRDLGALMDRARSAGLPVRLTVEGRRPPLPAGLDLTAYRIVQDALTGALESARPPRAAVTVRYATGAVELEIRDARAAAATTAGDDDLVAALRERANLYGGRVDAGRRGDGDYAVHARLPLEPVP